MPLLELAGAVCGWAAVGLGAWSALIPPGYPVAYFDQAPPGVPGREGAYPS